MSAKYHFTVDITRSFCQIEPGLLSFFQGEEKKAIRGPDWEVSDEWYIKVSDWRQVCVALWAATAGPADMYNKHVGSGLIHLLRDSNS